MSSRLHDPRLHNGEPTPVAAPFFFFRSSSAKRVKVSKSGRGSIATRTCAPQQFRYRCKSGLNEWTRFVQRVSEERAPHYFGLLSIATRISIVRTSMARTVSYAPTNALLALANSSEKIVFSVRTRTHHPLRNFPQHSRRRRIIADECTRIKPLPARSVLCQT